MEMAAEMQQSIAAAVLERAAAGSGSSGSISAADTAAAEAQVGRY